MHVSVGESFSLSTVPARSSPDGNSFPSLPFQIDSKYLLALARLREFVLNSCLCSELWPNWRS